MSTISIYNNANATTRTITVDIFADLWSQTVTNTSSQEMVYYFKFITSATQTDGTKYIPVQVTGLSDLALNGVKQSATNTSAPYASIDAMIEDYTYDFIEGHTANQFGSGCKAQLPMK